MRLGEALHNGLGVGNRALVVTRGAIEVGELLAELDGRIVEPFDDALQERGGFPLRVRRRERSRCLDRERDRALEVLGGQRVARRDLLATVLARVRVDATRVQLPAAQRGEQRVGTLSVALAREREEQRAVDDRPDEEVCGVELLVNRGRNDPTADPREQLEIRGVVDHRERFDERARFGRERLEALRDTPLGRERVGIEQQLDRLRHSAGPREHARDGVVRLEVRLDAFDVELTDVEPGRAVVLEQGLDALPFCAVDTRADARDEQRSQAPIGRHAVAPRSGAFEQEREELERPAVGALEAVEHDDRRADLGDLPKQCAQRVEELEALFERGDVGAAQRGRRGERVFCAARVGLTAVLVPESVTSAATCEPAHVRGRRATDLFEEAERALDDLGERSERPPGLGATLEDDTALEPNPAPELREDSRLPDAARPDEQREALAVARGLFVELPETTELGLAAYAGGVAARG